MFTPIRKPNRTNRPNWPRMVSTRRRLPPVPDVAPAVRVAVLRSWLRSKEHVPRSDVTALVYPLLDMRHRTAVERLLSAARFVTAAVLLVALSSNTGALHPESAKVLMLVYLDAAALLVVAGVHAPSPSQGPPHDSTSST